MRFAKLDERVITPTQANIGDAGYDLYALLEEPLELGPQESRLIPTGLVFEVPSMMAGLILPRSSLSNKRGIIIPNSPGLIDSGYRGEIKVGLRNISDERYTIENGDRIAQFVLVNFINPFFNLSMNEVDVKNLSTSTRGTGGFGSSGV